MKASIPRAAAGHHEKNLAAAKVIMSDTAKFGGPGSLPVQWAERVLTAEPATWPLSESYSQPLLNLEANHG